MVPPGERLHPGDPAGGQVELGLVVHLEGLLGQGPVQVAEQGEPLGAAAVHGVGVDQDVTTVAPGGGQGGVGATQQLCGVLHVPVGRGGDAHPGTDADDGVGQGDRVRDGGAQLCGQACHPARPDHGDGHGEVLPGEADHGGTGQREPDQAARHLAQHLVRDVVTERVGHLTEPVDHHDQDGGLGQHGARRPVPDRAQEELDR